MTFFSWLHHSLSILFYIITPIILAFWLALAYDLLGNKCTIDGAIISKLVPLRENGGKLRYLKVLSRLGIEQVGESGKRKKKPFLFF